VQNETKLADGKACGIDRSALRAKGRVAGKEKK